MRNNKGFTIFELIVTVSILLVIILGVVLVLPNFNAKQELKARAWQLANDLMEMRERAMTQLDTLHMKFIVRRGGGGNHYGYIWEKKEGAIQEAQSNGYDIKYIMEHPGEFPDIVVRTFVTNTDAFGPNEINSVYISYPWSFADMSPAPGWANSGIDIGEGNGSQPNSVVFGTTTSPNTYVVDFYFNKWGRPSSGGHINIVDRDLYGDNDKPLVMTVIISPATGRIRMKGPYKWIP